MTARHVRIPLRAADALTLEWGAAEAFEAGALGLEERETAGSAWLYALGEDAGGIAEALARVPGLAVGSAEPLVEEAWSERWKEGLAAIVISPRLLVRPSFRAAPAGFRGAELVIEPGQAFGTGGHASTRLALAGIAALPARRLLGACVLDVGCGSGVLALAALALGAARAVGCDLDPLATLAAREAERTNAYTGRLALFTGSTDALGAAAGAAFGVVVANLLRRELLPVLPDLARVLAPGGALVLAGLLAAERGEVEAALAALGLGVEEVQLESDPGGDVWLGLRAARL